VTSKYKGKLYSQQFLAQAENIEQIEELCRKLDEVPNRDESNDFRDYIVIKDQI
jgi:hypothetical protein